MRAKIQRFTMVTMLVHIGRRPLEQGRMTRKEMEKKLTKPITTSAMFTVTSYRPPVQILGCSCRLRVDSHYAVQIRFVFVRASCVNYFYIEINEAVRTIGYVPSVVRRPIDER